MSESTDGLYDANTSAYALDTSGTNSVAISRADGKSFKVATVLSQNNGTDLLLDIEDLQSGQNPGANNALSTAQAFLIGAESMSAGGNTATIGGQVEYTSSSAFTVSNADANTDDEGEEFIAGSQGSALSKISDISVATADGALAAISTIDGALEKINAERADLGAVSNRLDYTMNNLGSIKVNTEASLSRVMDADFAVETSNLTKAQILSQAATAMLAQANASKQAVLSLLQG
jgi:flagellin